MLNKKYPVLTDYIGNTPIVQLQHLNKTSNTILLKLEGNNPSSSVKDRAAYNMIRKAQLENKIKPGDTLIEATSGNTGIALAMNAAIMGYKIILLMPEDMSEERVLTMKVYGAQIKLISTDIGIEGARDLALQMQHQGKGFVLDQFANIANSQIHYETTGPEIWEQTKGEITHFISAMGTTGTITGTSKFLKEQNSKITTIGLQPQDGSQIPGIRKWSKEYMPKIFDDTHIDKIVEVSQQEAENMAKTLAKKEGIFAGISSGANVFAALKIAQNLENQTIVVIICDRGDRYLSTKVFD